MNTYNVVIGPSAKADFERKERQREDKKWFDRMRARAERGETPDLTMEEIIAEIAQARAERHAKEGAK
ncbi:MAG: hypothetical protein J6W95_05565 [Bacteroidales bacterium]|nr:hypothetical protein [Bacteroidales bacterium]